jgi:glyoxylase-like metal-dependent hydrolase (beta-lactamase superfamily II)
MNIGNYEVQPVETGRFALDGGAMFGVVPKNLWNRSNPADESNRIELALRALLLKNKDRQILIDTGIGYKFDEKLNKIYKVDHSRYTLEKSLLARGTNRDQITDVILSHLHFDHCGGTTCLENGELKLTFPNAMHHIQKEQWDWALNPSEKDKASFLAENFTLIEKEARLSLLNGPGNIFPGIESIVFYGHTHGMQLLKITDDRTSLLFCADLIPTASHIPIPWIMAYDNNPLGSIEEKKRILPKVVEENWILFFEHDPYISAGTVMRDEKGYKLKQEVSL